MITIISNNEYKRRDRSYHKKNYDSRVAKKKYQEQLKVQGKPTKKDKILRRRKKIKDLLVEGLKRKNICLELDISIKTYKRDIQVLKEQGLI